MKTVLGVDGGNSKTDVVIADQMGKPLAHVRGPGCSPDALGVTGSISVLKPLIATAVNEAGLSGPFAVDVGALLLAGVDRADQEEQVSRAIEPLGIAHQLVVSNDTFAVLLAGSSQGHGVAVVCGAGLNAVGVAPDNTIGRYQALGELSGDWGGGYDVGMAALGAAIRGNDGRGPATVLTSKLCERFKVANPQEIAASIHEGRLDDQILVDLPPLVFQAASLGDAPAVAIIERVGDEVSAMATAMMRRLNLVEMDTELILGGGLLQAGNSRLIDRIERLVGQAVPTAKVGVLDVLPVVGCVRAGLVELSIPKDEVSAALDELRKNLGSTA